MSIKVSIIGDEAVGKSCLVRKLLTGVFDEDYRPTVIFDTACIPEEKISLWDTTGDSKYSYHDFPLIGTQVAIFMFDVTVISSYKNLFARINKFQEMFPDIPFLICGNKCDLKNREITAKYNVLNLCYDCPYFDISVKSDLNLDEIISCVHELVKKKKRK